MPEPLLTETVTDLDGRESGELEFELNASQFRSRRGGGGAWQASLEGEWLATRHLGVRLEPSLTQTIETAGASSERLLGINGGVSWKLLQDFRHDFHLQAEATGRYPWETNARVDPGESALPLSFDLRSGIRRGFLTIRAGVGVNAGAAAAHLPLRGSLALLTGFGTSDRFGFWGIEVDADGARRAPVVVALNIFPNLIPLGLPGKFGLAIPLAIGVGDWQPSMGVFVRVFIDSASEIEQGRKQFAQ